jgi:disulfide bond formation protein DsbB
MEIVDLVIDGLSLLTVAADILLVIALVILALALLNKNYKGLKKNKLVSWVGERGLLLSFIVAIVATLGSLFLSEIAGYEPCKLCWYQRIFMYPLVILFGIALEKRDKSIVPYGLTLAGIGSAIAAFHYYLQLVPTTPLVPCSTVGIAVSCTTREFTHFGYVTIPMMALTAFLLIIGALMATRIVSVKK